MSKYHAVRTNGFDSRKEAARSAELDVLAKLDLVRSIERQKKFVLIPKDEMGREIVYKADFYFWDTVKQEWVTEDVKSEFTRKLPVYRLKRRLLWRVHGIKITET